MPIDARVRARRTTVLALVATAGLAIAPVTTQANADISPGADAPQPKLIVLS